MLARVGPGAGLPEFDSALTRVVCLPRSLCVPVCVFDRDGVTELRKLKFA